jgi:hypothetical protein
MSWEIFSLSTPGSPFLYLAHAVAIVPDPILRDDAVITSSNDTVCVGQQMNLTYVPPTNYAGTATNYLWKIPGADNGTAFKDYEPNDTNSCYTNLAPSDLTNSYCHFYWCGDATNQTVTCTAIMNGNSVTESATLSLLSPTTNPILASTNALAPIAADTNYIRYSVFKSYDSAWLHFGPALNGHSGITFSQTNSSPNGFSGNFDWVQVITNYAAQTVHDSGPSTTVHSYPGLDTFYPYDLGHPSPNSVNDSPGVPLSSSSLDVSKSTSFNATMYLIWQASTNSTGGDKTVPVPLRKVNWNWSGNATNNSGWTLIPDSAVYPTNLNDLPATNEPTWTNNVMNFYITHP